MFLKDKASVDVDRIDGYHAANQANSIPIIGSDGKLPIAIVPVGTSSNHVSAGNHNHDNYVQGDSIQRVSGTSNLKSLWRSGFYDITGTDMSALNTPSTNSWHWVINAAHRSNNNGGNYNYGFQIAAANNTSNFFMRTTSQSGTGTWRTLWHNGNLTFGTGNDNMARGNHTHTAADIDAMPLTGCSRIVVGTGSSTAVTNAQIEVLAPSSGIARLTLHSQGRTIMSLATVNKDDLELKTERDGSYKVSNANGYIEIGAKNISYTHYQTDRPNHWFNKDVRVSGEIYAGSGYNNRVYHTGYKPSADDIGAAPNNHAHKSLLSNNLAGKTVSLNTYTLSAGTPNVEYYHCNTDGDGSNITGRPSDNNKTAFSLKVQLLRWASTSDYASMQTYVSYSDNTIYVRYCRNGTWTGWEKVYTTGKKPTASDVGALPLGGGTVTGSINSSLATNTHLDGNKGRAIINSTASSDSYTMFLKMNSKNGVWTMGKWSTTFDLFYTANSVITEGKNTYTKRLTILDEAGNSYFPGTITATLAGNATTATTLKTARNINGTSFNGSADITTNTWGMSRNIAIGNSTKPVNGSDNVTWTLAEIGAVPLTSGGNIVIHADSDSSSANEYILLKAGHNELKVQSSAGGSTKTQSSTNLTYNGQMVWTKGNTSNFGITNTSSTSGHGISLYNGAVAGAPDYGLMFQGISTFGNHGGVTSDWATYFTMGGANTRGWIFKSGNSSGGNIASINAQGVAVFNSKLGVGANINPAITLALGDHDTGFRWNSAGDYSLMGDNTDVAHISNKGIGLEKPIYTRSTGNRTAGMYGDYDSYKIGHIWSMGLSYKIAADGSNFGSLYGFAYKHTNNGTGGTMAGGHQAVWCENGTPRVALGTNLWVANNATINGTTTMVGNVTVNGNQTIVRDRPTLTLQQTGTDAPNYYGKILFKHMSNENVELTHNAHDEVRGPFGLHVKRGEGNNDINGKAYLDVEGQIFTENTNIKAINSISYSIFQVDGDANTYYPVRITSGSKSGFADLTISISRQYAWPAPNSWNTSTHRGGLTLTLSWNGDGAWGGNSSGRDLRVDKFVETYCTMVGGLDVSTQGVIVWLRGGGARYQLDSTNGVQALAIVCLDDYSDDRPVTFSPRGYDSGRVYDEVEKRKLNTISSLGTIAPEGGRNARPGITTYSYYNNGGPSSYGEVISFGNGSRGQAQLAVSWSGTAIPFVRSLRDVNDNWTGWNKIWTQAEVNPCHLVHRNGYYGLESLQRGSEGWIRTPQPGLIPYQSGGHGSLGTSSWPFNDLHTRNINSCHHVNMIKDNNNRSVISFTAAPGGNDPGLIAHWESNNSSKLWLIPSGDQADSDEIVMGASDGTWRASARITTSGYMWLRGYGWLEERFAHINHGHNYAPAEHWHNYASTDHGHNSFPGNDLHMHGRRFIVCWSDGQMNVSYDDFWRIHMKLQSPRNDRWWSFWCNSSIESSMIPSAHGTCNIGKTDIYMDFIWRKNPRMITHSASDEYSRKNSYSRSKYTNNEYLYESIKDMRLVGLKSVSQGTLTDEDGNLIHDPVTHEPIKDENDVIRKNDFKLTLDAHTVPFEAAPVSENDENIDNLDPDNMLATIVGAMQHLIKDYENKMESYENKIEELTRRIEILEGR